MLFHQWDHLRQYVFKDVLSDEEVSAIVHYVLNKKRFMKTNMSMSSLFPQHRK